VTTVYFVDPAIVCGPGRTQDEFDVDGTGYGVFFQNGPSFAPENLVTAPLTEESALAEVRLDLPRSVDIYVKVF